MSCASGCPTRSPCCCIADPDALPNERIAWAPETRQRRLEVLVGLAQSQAPALAVADHVHPVVVTSVRALMQMTLPPRELRSTLRPSEAQPAIRSEQDPHRVAGDGLRARRHRRDARPIQPARRHRRRLAAQHAHARPHRAVRRRDREPAHVSTRLPSEPSNMSSRCWWAGQRGAPAAGAGARSGWPR